MKKVSTIATEHEVLKNDTQAIAGNYMLLVHGTVVKIKQAATTLSIHIGKDNLNKESGARVLSGGETSSFQ